MVCPYCTNPTRVTNSRPSKQDPGVWRRRACSTCAAVFSTRETLDFATTLLFQSNNGKLAPFDRDKLYVSIYESCKHRQRAISDATHLTNTCIAQCIALHKNRGIITRSELQSVVVKTLQQFDSAAATYFAAYHPA